MSLLEIVQNACDQIGVKRPSAVFGNGADEIVKLRRYANQTGIHLRKLDWQALRAEQTFVSVATEAQTSTMLPTDWDHFIDRTFWNRTRGRRLNGPLTPEEWQAIKATSGSAVSDSFAYRGSIFYVSPVPPAGETYAYEYGSTKFCQSAGGTPAAAWAADTDTARIAEELFTLGCVWRFNQAAGLSWEGDFQIYESEVRTALMQDRPRHVIDMSGERAAWPRVRVPEGNWPL